MAPDLAPRPIGPDPRTPLSQRWPTVGADRLLAELVPPPRFSRSSFEGFRPDPAHATQADAVRELEAYARSMSPRQGSWWRPRPPPGAGSGRYLDGGFGVGKTHLLAALWHAAPAPRAFGTFVEYTNLVGALGFADSVEALRRHRLVCIDEFELDDPGDTVLMSTLLSRLSESGVFLAATSNTLPGALGEGRFAAEDFLREIQALAGRFTVVHIDGEDYRHRDGTRAPDALPERELRAWAREGGAAVDDFDDLLHHLAELHPSRYGALLDGVYAVAWTGVHPVDDQSVALRLVVLADRLYDREVPLRVSGESVAHLFPQPLLDGGYRKKYLRALSRLSALAQEVTVRRPSG